MNIGIFNNLVQQIFIKFIKKIKEYFFRFIKIHCTIYMKFYIKSRCGFIKFNFINFRKTFL